MKGFLKFLFWLILIVDLAILNAAVVALCFFPPTFDVERSVVIDAPPSKVYPRLATLKDWKDWTVWNDVNHPGLKYSYEGPESGVGAVSNWTDPKMGDGKLEITDADPDERLEYTLKFEGFDNPMHGRFRLKQVDEGTKIVWTAHGDMGSNPLGRWMVKVMDMDETIGNDFNTSLAKLKKQVESGDEKIDDGEPARIDEDPPEPPEPE